MEIAAADEGTFERGDDGRFAGEVWLRPTLAAEDGTNVGIVHFSPGARTHWHQHPGGQFLYGVAAPTRAMLDRQGIHHIYNESGGGHTWINWRRYLNDFLPRLF